MRFTLALTGKDRAAADMVAAHFPGADRAIPLAEGWQTFPTREQAETSASIWHDRMVGRLNGLDLASVECRAWMPDYELTGEGPDIMRSWMDGYYAPNLTLGAYLAGALAAAQAIAAGQDVELFWYGRPRLGGIHGYAPTQVTAARRMLAVATHVCPSFKIRRLIGERLTFDQQRQRTRRGFEDLAQACGADKVLPELSPTRYGDGSFEAVPAQDIHAALLGLADAGCRRVLIWAQAESPAVAAVVAEHAAVFMDGAEAVGMLTGRV